MTRLKDVAGALNFLGTSDLHHDANSVLDRHFIIRPNSRCFTLTRVRKIKMNALCQLVYHLPTKVIPHDAVGMIKNAAHLQGNRCSAYVLARKDFDNSKGYSQACLRQPIGKAQISRQKNGSAWLFNASPSNMLYQISAEEKDMVQQSDDVLGRAQRRGKHGRQQDDGVLVIRTIAMPADTNPAGDIFGG